jgi:hypothetical protein
LGPRPQNESAPSQKTWRECAHDEKNFFLLPFFLNVEKVSSEKHVGKKKHFIDVFFSQKNYSKKKS